MLIKNSSDSIENRNFDLPVYSAEPQPTALINARAETYKAHKARNNLELEHLKMTYHIEALRFSWGMMLKQTLK